MVLPLKELAAKKVAENFVGDQYVNKDIKISLPASDKVMEIYRDLWSYGDRAPEMSRQLITTVANIKNVNEQEMEILKGQNCLETLKITEFDSQLQDYHKDNKIMLVYALFGMINEHSRLSLTSLSLNGIIPSNSDHGWMYPLSILLPNLLHLAIPNSPLDDINFSLICNGFKKLTKLDLSSCQITTLHGISKLSQLEALKIGEMDIDVWEFRELCSVKTLRVLDMTLPNSYHDRCESICHLADCVEILGDTRQRPLQNLQVLDATCTDITYEAFEKFRDHLESLQVFCLVGTPLEELSISSNKFKLFKSLTLEDRLDSLKLRIECNHLESIEDLVHFIMQDNLNEITTELRENRKWRAETIKLICKAINVKENELVLPYGSRILTKICNNTTIAQLTREEIEDIIRVYYNNRHKIYNHDIYKIPELNNFWSLFRHPDFLRNLKTFKIDVEVFIRSGLELCAHEEDRQFYIRSVYPVFQNIFDHPDYSDALVGEYALKYFFLHFYAARTESAHPSELMSKMKVTLAAVHSSRVFADQFVNFNVFQKIDGDYRVFRFLPVAPKLKTLQLDVKRWVAFKATNLKNLDRRSVSTMVQNYCRELEQIVGEVDRCSYYKYCICFLLAHKIELKLKIKRRIEKIQRSMNLDASIMATIRQEPREQEMFRRVTDHN